MKTALGLTTIFLLALIVAQPAVSQAPRPWKDTYADFTNFDVTFAGEPAPPNDMLPLVAAAAFHAPDYQVSTGVFVILTNPSAQPEAGCDVRFVRYVGQSGDPPPCEGGAGAKAPAEVQTDVTNCYPEGACRFGMIVHASGVLQYRSVQVDQQNGDPYYNPRNVYNLEGDPIFEQGTPVAVEPQVLGDTTRGADYDTDNYAAHDEILRGSHPYGRHSTPTTDEDGDGTSNQNEATATYPAAFCSGSLYVVATVDCGGYTLPAGAPACGGTTLCAPVIVLRRPAPQYTVEYWVWDAICTRASMVSPEQFQFDTCGQTSNRAAARPAGADGRITPYVDPNPHHQDGFGYRLQAEHTWFATDPAPLVLNGPCQTTEDTDEDRIPFIRDCRYTIDVAPDGSHTQQVAPQTTGNGDPAPTDPNNPIPQAFIADSDNDGHSNTQEALNSNPLDSTSNPSNARVAPDCHSANHLCGQYGFAAPSSGNYVLITTTPGPQFGRITIYDAVCSPSPTTIYEGMRARCAQTNAPSTETQTFTYSGTWTNDGYGYRYAADPSAGAQVVEVHQPCGIIDQDNDGTPEIRICRAKHRVDTAQGTVSCVENCTTDSPAVLVVGDLWPTDPELPVPNGVVAAAVQSAQQLSSIAQNAVNQTVEDIETAIDVILQPLIDEAIDYLNNPQKIVDVAASFAGNLSEIADTFTEQAIQASTGITDLAACADAARSSMQDRVINAFIEYADDPIAGEFITMEEEVVDATNAYAITVANCDAQGPAAEVISAALVASAQTIQEVNTGLVALIENTDPEAILQALLDEGGQLYLNMIQNAVDAVDQGRQVAEAYTVDTLTRLGEAIEKLDAQRIVGSTIEQADPPSEQGHVRVRFDATTNDTAPVANITITVYKDDTQTAQGRTNQDGRLFVDLQAHTLYSWDTEHPEHDYQSGEFHTGAPGTTQTVSILFEAQVQKAQIQQAWLWGAGALAIILFAVIMERRNN